VLGYAYDQIHTKTWFRERGKELDSVGRSWRGCLYMIDRERGSARTNELPSGRKTPRGGIVKGTSNRNPKEDIMKHSSTPQQRVRWVSELIAQSNKYGVVSQMSHSYGISRQTLYSLKARGQAALERELSPKEQQIEQKQRQVQAILTLFTEAHASYRGIQVCLESLLGIHVSIGKIATIIQDAGKRAQELIERQIPKGKRAIALDEQFGSKRGEAYLNIVDVLSRASFGECSTSSSGWRELDYTFVVNGRTRVRVVYDCE
jgi:hypothetical protein